MSTSSVWDYEPGQTQWLTLPWPPSINHYYGVSRTGRRFIKKPGVEYRKKIINQILAEKMVGLFLQEKCPYLGVQITFIPPDKRKRDADNLKKALFDALQHAGLYSNDCQIKSDSTVMEIASLKPGKVLLEIFEIIAPKETTND